MGKAFRWFHAPGLAPGENEIGLLKELQVLHHRAAIQVREELAEHARRLRFLLQRVEHPSPQPFASALKTASSFESFDMLCFYNILSTDTIVRRTSWHSNFV